MTESLQQMYDNIARAATMRIGASFDLSAAGVSMRTIRQTETLCNKARKSARNPGRICITVNGGTATVKAVR